LSASHTPPTLPPAPTPLLPNTGQVTAYRVILISPLATVMVCQRYWFSRGVNEWQDGKRSAGARSGNWEGREDVWWGFQIENNY